MYFGCIKFIKTVKKGVSFGESSPMLNDISAVPSWDKVTQGLMKKAFKSFSRQVDSTGGKYGSTSHTTRPGAACFAPAEPEFRLDLHWHTFCMIMGGKPSKLNCSKALEIYPNASRFNVQSGHWRRGTRRAGTGPAHVTLSIE